MRGLVSDLPALSEIIDDGITGRLFNPGDVKDLANCIEELCREGVRGERLGQAAKAWVENRTWSSVIHGVPSLYEELIKQN